MSTVGQKMPQIGWGEPTISQPQIDVEEWWWIVGGGYSRSSFFCNHWNWRPLPINIRDLVLISCFIKSVCVQLLWMGSSSYEYGARPSGTVPWRNSDPVSLMCLWLWHTLATIAPSSGSFLCVFKKTQGQPKKTQGPFCAKNSSSEANSDFTKKFQEISNPNYGFS